MFSLKKYSIWVFYNIIDWFIFDYINIPEKGYCFALLYYIISRDTFFTNQYIYHEKTSTVVACPNANYNLF